MNLFIVDDSVLIQKKLKDTIEKNFEDINISLFNSSEELLNFIEMKIKKPDFIFLDVILPGIDGLKTCKILKKLSDLDSYIFIMTSQDTDETLEKAFKSGADDFILKPLREPEIIARLKTYIKLKNYIDKLEELNKRDFLTELYNKSQFYENLKKVVYEEDVFSVLFIDIDDFKQINDTYGHMTGDHILEELGKIIKKYENKMIVPFRYGGEEFSILIKKYDRQKAYLVAEELRKKIEDKLFYKNIKVTISGGVADNSNIDNYSDIIEIADSKLYIAKSNGKNQIVI
ncbi:diguanylate cyclase [Geotoga petraea]|jgi:diguanylate cyclase (GGDEF)-like protein|nr:diguanylate cyclase [Geotoga petraea]MDK2946344.1 two-component system, sensor histidine kinase ChiS [Geotoga sp.]SDC25567.1 diguanylate cyclase (GGDEF) domain-containing protein [Geotoga petraea]